MALDCIEALNPEGLFRTVVEQRISMCGFIPTVVMLKAALLLGATQSEIVAYGNSGDVTNDYNDVVAYAAALVSG
jgi:AmmeMemoRadiSam system protein B